MVVLLPQAAAAQFDPRGLAEREGYLCEPDLLKRRIDESSGARREFLMAIDANAVDVYSGDGVCSGTFITPTCVLTAAHCMPRDDHRDMWVKHPESGQTLKGGLGRQYPGWTDFNVEDVDRVFHYTEGDTGVVLFDRAWPGFRPLTVWGFLGNRNFWIFDYDEGDGGDIPQAALNSYHWSDFGTLGTTTVAPLRVGDTRRARCTSAHFGWAPGAWLMDANARAQSFTQGRIHFDADSGPGMSGGAVYDDRGILGTHTSGPSTYLGEEMEEIPGTGMRLLEREKKRPGFGGDFTILLPRQVRWVQTMCAGADIRRRYSLKGPRVSDRAARGANGYIGAVEDPWAGLGFSARQTHVSRAMDRGDRGIFVRRLEAQLKRLGYLDRAPGEVFDETTETAVRRFQFERRLHETGKADIRTLQVMGILVE